MKILIIHASAGQGHRRCAEAIYHFLIQNTSHSVTTIDSLDFTTSLFKFFYIRGYTFLISRFPKLWGFFYHLTDKPKNRFLNSSLRRFNNNLNSRKLRSFLKKENFDFIISTHFFANDIISVLKERKFISTKLICVITDYLVHYYWISSGVDKYLVACQRTKENLINLGVEEEKIAILGIPVDARFRETADKNDIRQRLNLDPQKFCVLMVTGAFGFGSLEKITQLLKDVAQLLVVCGNNQKLYQKLAKAYSGANLKIFGLVKNMHELMSVADVIITKPGGLTISEALVKNLPMIFISAIPGQEVNNAAFMQELGLGIVAENLEEIKELVKRFKTDSEYLEQFKKRISEFSHLNIVTGILKAIS